MNPIDKYFRRKADKLSYIELRENRIESYEKYGLNDIPLPIILDDMMDGIASQDFQNEIKMQYIVDGILFNIAVDPSFLYIEDYKNFLRTIMEDPSNYALSRYLKRPEYSLIFARAAFLLNERNELAAYSYASALWTLDVPKKEEHVFVEESVRILERILNYNDENPLANYELGNISRATGNNIKANSYYSRALSSTNEEELKEHIRDAIKDISPDVAVENAIYYINRMNYSKAIEGLMEARKNSGRYDIPYYIAIAYLNQERPDLAEEFFEEAIDKGADFANLYTDLVYVKYILNKEYEALAIANQALEVFPSEIKLRYNRAIIYISQGRYDKANEDFDFILEYQDLSDEMFNQIMKIKESFRN